jgi:hypothetical protein
LGCSLCWVCTCANCCLFKMIATPCKACIKAIKRYHATKKSKRTRNHTIIGFELTAQALLLQSFPTAPTMSDQSRNESSKLTYTPTVLQFSLMQIKLSLIALILASMKFRFSLKRRLDVNQFRSSSSERSHRKPRPLRVTRQLNFIHL